MRSSLVVFVLSTVSILADFKIVNSSDPGSATTTGDNNSLAAPFLFETLAVAAGEHFIRGDGFDVPSREDQEIAVIFGNLFHLLPSMRKLAAVLTDTSKMTGEFYRNARAPQVKANTMHIHYGVLQSVIRKAPQLEPGLYDMESEKVSKQTLPSLRNGQIDLDDGLQIMPRLQKLLAETVSINEKLRELTIHSRFAHYATGLTKNEMYELPYAYGRCLTALAIMKLSERLEVEKLTQQFYDLAVEIISSRIGNETSEDRIDEMIFSIIDGTFEKNKYLYDQLEVTRGKLSRLL